VIPILDTKAMRDADAAAGALVAPGALVQLAGTAVALEAKRMLTSCYAKRVAVIAGPGLNGDDGRVAARWLASRGARVRVIEWDHAPATLDGVDLVVDAAFGLGCSRPYVAPKIASGVPVLAVDLPSGVDADTGALLGQPLPANVTLALGALKPAHLNGPAATYVGELRFAGLGIVHSFEDGLVEDSDLSALLESEDGDHKWSHAVQAFVGSSLMPGAAELVLRGALAGGASMIRLVSRGDVAAFVELPPEAVRSEELKVEPRSKSVVAGPGLGAEASDWLREAFDGLRCPVVLDADGLDRTFIDERAPKDASWLLTPHEGEFKRLTGHAVGADRFEDVRSLARETGCVVLLKGPTTVIAHPAGQLRVVTSGTAALATAGTGDVLAGLIGATIARGHEPFEAAALAAHLHGRAGSRLSLYSSALDVVSAIRTIVRDLDRLR
jgi:ADP-dependent NAD(P)H-hydrate dehydratase / NAD(P)H-hydrate epimerase